MGQHAPIYGPVIQWVQLRGAKWVVTHCIVQELVGAALKKEEAGARIDDRHDQLADSAGYGQLTNGVECFSRYQDLADSAGPVASSGASQLGTGCDPAYDERHEYECNGRDEYDGRHDAGNEGDDATKQDDGSDAGLRDAASNDGPDAGTDAGSDGRLWNGRYGKQSGPSTGAGSGDRETGSHRDGEQRPEIRGVRD